MTKQNTLLAYLLIGIGVFFLFRELRLPIFTDFYSWQTLLIIIGTAILIYSYRTKNYKSISIGFIIAGIGIHLHGQANYSFWINHWAVYFIIIGAAYLLRWMKAKSGLLIGVVFLSLGVMLLYTKQFNAYFEWVNDLFVIIERFWPILLIIFGLFLMRKNK